MRNAPFFLEHIVLVQSYDVASLLQNPLSSQFAFGLVWKSRGHHVRTPFYSHKSRARKYPSISRQREIRGAWQLSWSSQQLFNKDKGLRELTVSQYQLRSVLLYFVSAHVLTWEQLFPCSSGKPLLMAVTRPINISCGNSSRR